MSYKVTSIFLSIDGEVNKYGQGKWSVFIRMFGCKSGQCSYCDTTYSKGDTSHYDEIDLKELLYRIDMESKGCKKVTITGGEPLEQGEENIEKLLKALRDKGYNISLETNGVYNLSNLILKYPQVSYIVDYKLPTAGNVFNKMNISNFKLLRAWDRIKMVICNRHDFEVGLDIINQSNDIIAPIYFSPCGNELSPMQLFYWMKQSNCPELNIGYNLQLHKYIFKQDWRDEEK